MGGGESERGGEGRKEESGGWVRRGRVCSEDNGWVHCSLLPTRCVSLPSPFLKRVVIR